MLFLTVETPKIRGHAQRWGWSMRRWRRFDRGNFDLTGPRLSHESKCVSQALEMEGRSLWLWHPCEGLRLLGVKCDTSLGRCWFSAATAQQTSSQGVPRGVWARGVGSATHRPENGGLMPFIHKAIIWLMQITYLRPTPYPAPLYDCHYIFTLSVLSITQETYAIVSVLSKSFCLSQCTPTPSPQWT